MCQHVDDVKTTESRDGCCSPDALSVSYTHLDVYKRQEHVIVEGRVGKLRHALPHHNVESLDRYLTKHNEYSNWEAKVLLQETEQRDALPPKLFGNQAQRRRWLKKRFFGLPGSPLFFFLYKYILRCLLYTSRCV